MPKYQSPRREVPKGSGDTDAFNALIQEIKSREIEVDRRSALRRAIDQNREAVVAGYGRGLTWAGIAELLHRQAGISGPDGGPLPAQRLRRIVDRARILYDQPDPAAPAHARVTATACPLAARKRGIDVSANG